MNSERNYYYFLQCCDSFEFCMRVVMKEIEIFVVVKQ
jgi:hypothetical protein